MKKISLLPLVAAMAVAGTAQAQTAPSVSVYGQLDALFTSWTTDNQRVLLEEGARSRVGFRGEDKLNNGWTAFFQLEERFRLDTALPDPTFTSTNRRWGNKAWVGVKGGFGEVSFGYVPTALDYIYGGAKMGGNDTIGDFNSRRAEADDRTNNGISYRSPKLGIATFFASFGLAEGTQQTLDTSTVINGTGGLLRNGTPDEHVGLAVNLNFGDSYLEFGASQDRDLWRNGHLNGGIKISPSLELVAGLTTSQRYSYTVGATVIGNENEEHNRLGIGVKMKIAGGDASIIAGLGEVTDGFGVEAADFKEIGAQFSYPLSSRVEWLSAVSYEMQDGAFDPAVSATVEDSRIGLQTGVRMKF